jgi:uncharacterized SAM-binding protein YcdF (DUF218 family)
VGLMARSVLVIGVLAGALIGYATFRILDQGARDERRQADAIVVLGAAQYDGRPSPVFAARIDHAVELYHEGLAPILIVTGGKAAGDRTTEAASARAYAIDRGVPDTAILAEERSRTTRESIAGIAHLMREQDLTTAVFVSDPSHMLRVLRMASDAGITGYGSATTTSPVERDPVARADAVVHELGALALYLLSGRSP